MIPDAQVVQDFLVEVCEVLGRVTPKNVFYLDAERLKELAAKGEMAKVSFGFLKANIR